MFECKCCEILKNENKYLRELVDQLIEQLAPKPDPSDAGASSVPEGEIEEIVDEEGGIILKDTIGIGGD